MRDMRRPVRPRTTPRAGVLAAPVDKQVSKLRRDGRSVYAGVPLASALGVGGASACACRRRTGFDTLATVVAATTLLMAGVSVCKLLPRRRPDALVTNPPVPTARDQPTVRVPGERTPADSKAGVA